MALIVVLLLASGHCCSAWFPAMRTNMADQHGGPITDHDRVTQAAVGLTGAMSFATAGS